MGMEQVIWRLHVNDRFMIEQMWWPDTQSKYLQGENQKFYGIYERKTGQPKKEKIFAKTKQPFGQMRTEKGRSFAMNHLEESKAIALFSCKYSYKNGVLLLT